jgi:hypothetical protein
MTINNTNVFINREDENGDWKNRQNKCNGKEIGGNRGSEIEKQNQNRKCYFNSG